MPIVHVFLWEGRKENEIKEMVKKMTKVFVDMGIPENAVEIIVQACKARWAIGGELEKTFSVVDKFLKNKLLLIYESEKVGDRCFYFFPVGL